MPPTAAGAEDDEFTTVGAGAPTGWTEYDHGTQQTVSVVQAGLVLDHPAHAGASVTGIYKAIPAGDFTIWTKVHLSALGNTNFAGAGMALFEDASVSTGDIRTHSLHIDANDTYMLNQSMTAYNSAQSTVHSSTAGVGGPPEFMYLRIRRATTTYSYDFSSDGIGWQRKYTTAALGITPTHFGLIAQINGTGTGVRPRFEFFRYADSDVGLTFVMGGASVDLSPL